MSGIDDGIYKFTTNNLTGGNAESYVNLNKRKCPKLIKFVREKGYCREVYLGDNCVTFEERNNHSFESILKEYKIQAVLDS